MILKILEYPDKRLYNKSKEIETITDEIKTLAYNMAETMYEAKGVGIAAPQVGEFIRLVAIDQSAAEARDQLMYLVNPSYTILDTSKLKGDESCLSVPDCKESVTRYSKILVKALNLEGQELEFEASDFLAIIVQHEIDHLDGKLFINHLSHLKRSIYAKKMQKLLAEELDKKSKSPKNKQES